MTHIAYEWKAMPDEVLRQSPRFIVTMLRYLRWRAVQMEKATARKR